MPRINLSLHSDQLKAVLEMLFVNRPVKILRSIARAGRSQVVWLHFECEITKTRRASFVSFKDLLDAFWRWMETAQLMLMAFWEQNAVSRAVWSAISIGEYVYHRYWGWVQVVHKDFEKYLPRFWVRYENRTPAVQPWEVSKF